MKAFTVALIAIWTQEAWAFSPVPLSTKCRPRTSCRTRLCSSLYGGDDDLNESDKLLQSLKAKREKLRKKKENAPAPSFEAPEGEDSENKLDELVEKGSSTGFNATKPPEWKFKRKGSEAPPPGSSPMKSPRSKARHKLMTDFLDNYEDENEFHIPNRIGFSTEAWGDTGKGFVSENKKLTKKQLRVGNFGETQLEQVFKTMVDAGVRFVHTSESYGAGSRKSKQSAEQLISKFAGGMEDTDEGALVATSMGGSWSKLFKGQFGGGAVTKSAKASKERLEELESTSLYQLKCGLFYPGLIAGATKLLDEEGCKYVGAIGLGKGGVNRFADAMKRKGKVLTSNQFKFSLTNQKALKSGLIDACKDNNVIPLALDPLDGGLASGVFTVTNPGGGQRNAPDFGRKKLGDLQQLHQTLETVANRAKVRVKKEHRNDEGRTKQRWAHPPVNTEITTTQVALNYVIAKGAVPLPRVNTADEAKEVIGCLGWGLSDDELKMLDAAVAVCNL